MFESIGDILELIVDQEWDSFRSSALLDRDIFHHLDSAVSSCSQLNGMTVLHAVVRYNPPSEIVEQIIQYCPDMPAARDCLNRTPLHVAAGSGASAGLLNILARAYPEACDVQDDGGKTPLHVACDSACVLFEEDKNVVFYGRKQPPNHDAVSILLSYSFQASLLRDDEGMSPRDLAIQSNARGSTVCLLGYCQDLAWRHEQQLQRERQQQDYYDNDVDALVVSMASMSVSSAGSDSDSTFSTLNTDTSWDSE